jgi:hypothetical protein
MRRIRLVIKIYVGNGNHSLSLLKYRITEIYQENPALHLSYTTPLCEQVQTKETRRRVAIEACDDCVVSRYLLCICACRVNSDILLVRILQRTIA